MSNDQSSLAKGRLCRAQGMIDYRQAKLRDPNTQEHQLKHMRAEVQAIEYLMELAKQQLDADGVDYEGYENYGRELEARRKEQ